MSELKILFFGDIMGKIGRKGVSKFLPELKKKYEADLVIVNAENLAHGKGVTKETLQEMMDAGVDFFTSGDHIWENKDSIDEILSAGKFPIIRPANYPEGVAGDGYRVVEIGTKKLLIINLCGRVFAKQNIDCPFRKLEQILTEFQNQRLDGIFIDFHAEATSEKVCLGRYFDGQYSAMVGTHTHVQTADDQILPKGSAYITDAGFCGAKDSSIGVDLKNVVLNFLFQTPHGHELPEHGICQVNGVFVIIKPETKTAKKIKRIQEEIEI